MTWKNRLAVSFAALAFLSITSSAQAKSHHRHHSYQSNHRHYTHVRHYRPQKVKEAFASIPPTSEATTFSNPISGLVAAMERQLGTNPTGWRSVWCGQYLAMKVKEMGGTPPPGAPLAMAWANYGHAASPAPGVIAVMRGHVGVVRRVLGNGQVEIISGNHGRKVGIGTYSMSRVVAWRSA